MKNASDETRNKLTTLCQTLLNNVGLDIPFSCSVTTDDKGTSLHIDEKSYVEKAVLGVGNDQENFFSEDYRVVTFVNRRIHILRRVMLPMFPQDPDCGLFVHGYEEICEPFGCIIEGIKRAVCDVFLCRNLRRLSDEVETKMEQALAIHTEAAKAAQAQTGVTNIPVTRAAEA